LTIVRITACYATSCLLPHSQSISVGVACFCVLDGPLGEVINCLLQCSSAGQRPTAPVHFQPSKCGVLMVLHRVAMVVVVIKGPPNKCAHVYLDVNTKEENPKDGATFLGSRRVTVRPDEPCLQYINCGLTGLNPLTTYKDLLSSSLKNYRIADHDPPGHTSQPALFKDRPCIGDEVFTCSHSLICICCSFSPSEDKSPTVKRYLHLERSLIIGLRLEHG
jgi:hypothetical protein